VRREAAVSGVEWLVEAHGCTRGLADRATLSALFDEIIRDLELRVVGTPAWHVFPGAGGITGMVLLAESHLTVHTFPEHGSLCLNLFCCRARPDWDFAARLAALVGASDVTVRRFDRQYAESAVAILT
jgi:S-adenosylmethionine decarboxylase